MMYLSFLCKLYMSSMITRIVTKMLMAHSYPNIAKPMTRSEVEAREVVDIDEDISDQGAAHHMFARERNALIYQGGLDNGHWLHSMIRCLNDDEVTIELVNETHAAYFQGEWVSVSVRFCDAYRIKIGSDEVEITDDAIYSGSDRGKR